ncbi:MAG: protein kinase [Chitinivibrionales bacterium]|nr:protein kinase [Chitinivibrionales bacterium]
MDMQTPTHCSSCNAALPPASGSAIRCSRCGLVVNPESTAGGSSTQLPPAVIERPIGEYRFIRLLGSGGMGRVYLVYEPLLHRTVALKILVANNQNPDSEATVARFLAEAMLTGRLAHAGIVPIYQVGFDPAHGYYYSMRYVKGRTLQDILRARLRDAEGSEEYSLARLLTIYQRVCEAVGFAHHNGILHRDLKPTNVMLTSVNEVLVLDWGLAKDLHRHDPLNEVSRGGHGKELADSYRGLHTEATKAFLSHADDSLIRSASTAELSALASGARNALLEGMTQDGRLVGTPWYMSPEQIRGEPNLTPASDVYALGVMLYQLLCGRRPVEEYDMTVLAEKVINGDYTPLQECPEASRLPRALIDIVQRCLARSLSERYDDAAEIAADLELYLEGRSPLRTLTRARYARPASGPSPLDDEWTVERGEPLVEEAGVVLSEGTVLRSRIRSPGDFRATIGFRTRPGRWCLVVRLLEKDDDSERNTHHEIRIGQQERACLDLRCLGRRVQRRFDIRLQAERYYELGIELEEDHLRVRLDGTRMLTFRDIFPLSGGHIAVGTTEGTVVLRDFEWRSRGAPFHLSPHYLPDQHFRAGRFDKARELYQQLAEGHPDREEGLMALYKAGLCSATLADTPRAFEQISRLEGSMLDHYAILGLARIGILDGNPEWAWEALMSGYERHSHPDIRTDIWFGLLDVLEMMNAKPYEERRRKYRMLIDELDPSQEEAGQTSFEYLDMVAREQGREALKETAIELLRAHRRQPHIACEALMALRRATLDQPAIESVKKPLAKLARVPPFPTYAVRLQLMQAEVLMGQGTLDQALEVLEKALRNAGTDRADTLWARNWLLLCLYLRNQHERLIAEGAEASGQVDHCSSDHLGYSLFVQSLAFWALRQADRAKEMLVRAAGCSGWWGDTVQFCVSGKGPEELCARSGNPNLITEALLLCGELQLRAGRTAQALRFFTACRDHPCRRLMTRTLAMRRCESIQGTTSGGAEN